MYYPCSENKGADQLRGYREADLHLCFCIYKKPVFSQRGSFSGSFSVSVLSGKIMFRAVHYITEDFSVRIEYGWIIFKWWRPYVYKDIKEGNVIDTIAYEVYLIITLSLGSIEKDRVISETML